RRNADQTWSPICASGLHAPGGSWTSVTPVSSTLVITGNPDGLFACNPQTGGSLNFFTGSFVTAIAKFHDDLIVAGGTDLGDLGSVADFIAIVRGVDFTDLPSTNSDARRGETDSMILLITLAALTALAGTRITVLAEAVRAVITERSTSEWFASLPPGYIVIATDGAYEGLDTLKVVGSAGRVLGMSVGSHSIDDALEHPYIRMRANGPQLPTDCGGCAIAPWCSGGYYPSRYGRGRGFDNPTIYCEDMKVLFRHVAMAVASHTGVGLEDRQRIHQRLSVLSIGGRVISRDVGGE
ncbi:MAG: hypothetical protein EBR07_08560, partial [Planctomycetes bacterium]|nr:hypothetical protein [Planctomycetota bacterium]